MNHRNSIFHHVVLVLGMYLSVFVHGVVYNIGNASLYTDQHTDCMLQFGGLDSGASLCDALGEGGNSFHAKMQ